MSCVVVCIALGVGDVSRGSLPALIYPGDRVTWKVLAEYSWRPTTTQSGSFHYTAASSTPIRVGRREVSYTHELSLTLEHSMPISSPASTGLTVNPQSAPHGRRQTIAAENGRLLNYLIAPL